MEKHDLIRKTYEEQKPDATFEEYSDFWVKHDQNRNKKWDLSNRDGSVNACHVVYYPIVTGKNNSLRACVELFDTDKGLDLREVPIRFLTL